MAEPITGPRPRSGVGGHSGEPGADALTVYLMTDVTPAWVSSPGLRCVAAQCGELPTSTLAALVEDGPALVLVDAALFEEPGTEWVASLRETLGPVVVIGDRVGDAAVARTCAVAGTLPRSFMDCPGDLAQTVLLDFVDHDPREENALERFMRDAIHEFRTPLTVIMEFASLCEDGVAGPLSERQRSYMGHIQTAGARLCQELDDYRDAIRLQLGTLGHRGDSVPLNTTLRQALETSSVDATLLSEAPDVVLLEGVDSPRIHQVVQRVILAAAKLSRVDDPLRVSVAAADRHHVITVQYEGLVPSDVDVRVLEEETVTVEGAPYRSVTRVFGLGVTVARLLLRECGGELRIQPIGGSGGCFVITVPTRELVAPLADQLR